MLQRIVHLEDDKGEGDVVAVEAKYHHDCQVRFNKGHSQDKKRPGRPCGSSDSKKQQVFDKLCDYLDNNDDCQFSLPELVSLVNTFQNTKKVILLNG